MHQLRRLAALTALAVLSTVVALSPVEAAEDTWTPLDAEDGRTLAVALNARSTALISVGGSDDATIYDQRRSADGVLGPRTEIMTVAGAENCRPVEAATAIANLAVAVECQIKTGLEDPPTRLAQAVWTGDDGWATRVQPEGELGSLDYSPGGQYVLFTTNSKYGGAHQVVGYHADLGWHVTERPELMPGDELVAAVNDGGSVVAVRGAGDEDEPGYWYGGVLRVDTYDATTEGWTKRFVRRYRDGGIRPTAVDAVGGRMLATVVQSRSTGTLDGLADRVVLLTGKPGKPRLWSPRGWNRGILTASAAVTRAGVGVAAWHAVGKDRTAKPFFTAWPAGRRTPKVHDLGWRTTRTPSAQLGHALDLAVSPNGHGVIAYVRHKGGVRHSTVGAASFRVGPGGGLSRQVDATWRKQRVNTTVHVVSSANATSATLGWMTSWFNPSERTRFSVGP